MVEARELNSTQERLESSIIKLLSEVEEAIHTTETQIFKLEDELTFLRQHLLILNGKEEAFNQALKEVREELPEGVQ